MDKKFIYLVRHGDIGLGRDKRYIGQTDLSLSEHGKMQATVLKDFLGHEQYWQCEILWHEFSLGQR